MMGGSFCFRGTGCRSAAMAASFTATSGPGRCEAVLHSCGTSTVGGWCWFVVVYILATSKVTPGWVPTCDSAHSNQDNVTVMAAA